MASIIAESDKLSDDKLIVICESHPNDVVRFGLSLVNAVIAINMGYTFEDIADILSDDKDSE